MTLTRRGLMAGSLMCLSAIGVALPAIAQGTTPLRVQLNWTKTVESAPFFVALDKGFFTAEGIEADLRGGGPQIDPVALLASGAVDVAIVSSPLSVLAARARGVPIVVIGAGFQKSPLGLAARADSGIELPKGLARAHIGFQQVNRNLLSAMLKANGVDESGITTSVVTGDPTMLIERKIDLMTVSVLNVPLAMEGRGIPAKSWLAYDLGVAMQGMVVAVLEDTLAQKRDAIVGFMGASGRGMEYNFSHSDEIASIVVAKYGEGLDETHQKAFNIRQLPLMLSERTGKDGLFALDEASWETANKVALDTGLISKPVNLGPLLDESVLNEAGMPKVSP